MAGGGPSATVWFVVARTDRPPVPHASRPTTEGFTHRRWSRRPAEIDARATSPDVQVGLAALTIGLLFAIVLVAPLPLWAGQPQGPPSPGAQPASAVGWPGLVVALVFALGLCLPFRPYRGALHAASAVRSARGLVGLTVALALVALLIYPRFGSDIFDYLGFERTWVVYGENPLVGLPASHPSDWATPLVWYPDRSPAYGPLWAILTWPIVRLAGDSAALVVLGYKLLSAAAYALCCVLLWATVEPARRKRALVLFAWSPLVLFEVLGKVHNDVVIAAGVLTAVWLVQRGRVGLGLEAAVVGALGKLSALAVAPPITLRLWRDGGWRTLLPAVLGAAVLSSLIYAPFWAGSALLQPVLQQTSRVVWSPGTLLIRLADLFGSPAVVAVRVLLFAAWLAISTRVMWRARLATAAEVAASSGRLLLLSLLLLTTAVFGHYLVPAIALAAASADARLEHWVFWLSVGALAAYAVELLSLVFGPDWIGSPGYQVTGSLVLLGPVLLASAAATRRIVPKLPAQSASQRIDP
jgi:hypothetical protein